MGSKQYLIKSILIDLLLSLLFLSCDHIDTKLDPELVGGPPPQKIVNQKSY